MLNNFELHEKALDLRDQYTAYRLARMVVELNEQVKHQNTPDSNKGES